MYVYFMHNLRSLFSTSFEANGENGKPVAFQLAGFMLCGNFASHFLWYLYNVYKNEWDTLMFGICLKFYEQQKNIVIMDGCLLWRKKQLTKSLE